MVYLILDKHDNGIIDIEWYLDYFDQDKGMWRSEVKVTCIPKGLVYYGYNSYTNSNLKDLDAFLKDIQELRDLRFYLYEHWGNKPLPLDEARERHNRYTTLIDTNIKAFCKKYNFELDID